MEAPGAGKPALRRRLLAARAAAPPGDLLLEHLRPLVLGARRVASYASVGTEPSTTALNALRDDVLLPVLLPDGDLDWASGPLAPAARGLREPTGPRQGRDALADCDLVLVPALAVDRWGVRLGRGGGSYDRALRRARGRTLALLHDGELLPRLPADPHDVPVTGAVTPAGGVVDLTDGFADVLEGNARYAQAFAAGDLPGRAGRGLGVVTCMDARIDPLAVLGLQPGDAKVLRTAGGRVTDDVVSDLVVAAHFLGVERVLVMEHRDCGMAKNTEEGLRSGLAERGVDVGDTVFGTIADQEAKLRADVERLRSDPRLPAGLPVLGAFYDPATGRVEPVS